MPPYSPTNNLHIITLKLSSVTNGTIRDSISGGRPGILLFLEEMNLGDMYSPFSYGSVSMIITRRHLEYPSSEGGLIIPFGTEKTVERC